jgi:hypothetical protein
MGKPEGKRPLGRPSRGMENNVKMYLQGIGLGVDRIHLAQDSDNASSLQHSIPVSITPQTPTF